LVLQILFQISKSTEPCSSSIQFCTGGRLPSARGRLSIYASLCLIFLSHTHSFSPLSLSLSLYLSLTFSSYVSLPISLSLSLSPFLFLSLCLSLTLYFAWEVDQVPKARVPGVDNPYIPRTARD